MATLTPVHGSAKWILKDYDAESCRCQDPEACRCGTPSKFAGGILEVRTGDRVAWYTVVPVTAHRWVETDDGRRQAEVRCGWELREIDPDTLRPVSGDVYHIDTTFGNARPEEWACDCGDGTYRPHRPGGCRHRAALFAALRKIGEV